VDVDVRFFQEVFLEAEPLGARAEERAKLPADLNAANYALMTIHRAENTDAPELLSEICAFARRLAESGMQVVWPVHPRTAKMLKERGDFTAAEKSVLLIPPLGFLEMIRLERGARLIATDSGGVQKEAYFQKRPCVILRTETEWKELIEANAAVLAPPHTGAKAMFEKATQALQLQSDFPPLYGKGDASETIAQAIQDFQSH
jgi:UDP-GlcNAc3NAcA epimerase